MEGEEECDIALAFSSLVTVADMAEAEVSLETSFRVKRGVDAPPVPPKTAFFQPTLVRVAAPALQEAPRIESLAGTTLPSWQLEEKWPATAENREVLSILEGGAAYIPLVLSVVIVTSPIPSNPSTEMIEFLLQSFNFIPGLQGCQKFIICDGFRVGHAMKAKAGIVAPNQAERYLEYIQRLKDYVEKTENLRQSTSIITLPSRQGFGWAVLSGLKLVKTPYVMVVQHDRAFFRSFDLLGTLRAMQRHPVVKYVKLLTGSTINYQRKMKHRYQFHLEPIKVEAEYSSACDDKSSLGSFHLVPLLFWYDSTHICEVDHYMKCVFKRRLVKCGDFIEDTFGHRMLDDIKQNGVPAHEKYGTFIYDDGQPVAIVKHVHGRRFISSDDCE